MGTSTSSAGPGPGVPLVPPWVPPIEPAPGEPEHGDLPGSNDPPGPDAVPQDQQQPSPIVAPQGRFRGTRLNLGHFGSGGDGNGLRRGLGHYVKHGIGGAANGARRMAGTARTAGLLHSVLSTLSSGQTPPVPLGIDPRQLAGRSAHDIADVIIEAVRPIDGTQDTETARTAIYEAQVDLLEQFPDADLTALDAQQIDLMVERYIAHDLCLHIDLDVGKSVMAHAIDAATAIHRLEEIKQFVIQTVAACFHRRRSTGTRLDQRAMTTLAQSILRDTLDIFEEYIG